jgi:hypothetical protein
MSQRGRGRGRGRGQEGKDNEGGDLKKNQASTLTPAGSQPTVGGVN